MLLLAAEGGATNEVVTTTSGAIGLAWLIPVIPLLGFAAVLLATKPLRERAAFIAVTAAALSFVLSVLVFLQVASEPATHVRPLFTWIQAGPLEVSWTLLVDQLTAVMLLVVTGVGTLVHVYSFGYMHGDARYERFFAYLNLFLFSMLVLVLGSNLLTLFVGWELVGLSSYLLIGFWFESREYASAAKKAFITNRVGDVSFMVAMFLAFATFGTLDFFTTEGSGVLQQADSLSAGVAFALGMLLMGGAAAKSAQIPLYVWLPDAMAGPTPVSALIHAATMVTAGVYLTVRSSAILVQSLDAMTVIAWIGAATALLAALIAIRQDDIKKILAYSTVSQLGFMFMAVGTGGFTDGIFHLVTHAFFKGLLFLAAGSVMHAMANRTDAWKMGGLAKVMPIPFWTSAVAWLAISGLPPFAGFFSKDQLLTTAYEHGFTGIWAVGVLTAFYVFRAYFLAFEGPSRVEEDRAAHLHESPPSMTVPLVVLAVLSLAGGWVGLPHGVLWGNQIDHYLQPALAAVHGGEHHLGGGTVLLLTVLATAIALTSIGVAYTMYIKSPGSADRVQERAGGLFDVLWNKYYVDEMYEAVILRPYMELSRLFWQVVDARGIDGAVNGVARLAGGIGESLRRLQTGNVQSYALVMLVGAACLLLILVH